MGETFFPYVAVQGHSERVKLTLHRLAELERQCTSTTIGFYADGHKIMVTPEFIVTIVRMMRDCGYRTVVLQETSEGKWEVAGYWKPAELST